MTFLKFFGVPGSIAFLAAGVLAGVILNKLVPRRRWLSRAWLGMLAAAYLFLSLPIVATAIAGSLPGWPSFRPRNAERPPMLIVLDGDNRRGRVATTMEHHAQVEPPIYVLGTEWIPDELANLGVPRSMLTRVDGLPTTRAQMGWVEAFAADHEDVRLAVVASRLQMPRVAALAEAAGLELDFVASPVDEEPAASGVWRFVPAYIALRVSRDAIYEHAAVAYYRWQGWIG